MPADFELPEIEQDLRSAPALERDLLEVAGRQLKQFSHRVSFRGLVFHAPLSSGLSSIPQPSALDLKHEEPRRAP